MADPKRTGCTVCGTQDTATVDGASGRRCAEHPPTYDRDHTTALLADGRVNAAFAYLRGSLTFPRSVTR